jgi:alpha-tubulin suppressor-like RCC1 family protein
MVSNVPTAPVRNLTLGWDFGCAILTATDAVVCWGDDTFGITAAAPVGAFANVSAGTAHVCATTAANTVSCWGSNAFGKATAPTDRLLSRASAGDQHSCALTADGDRFCWGDAGDWTQPLVGAFTTVDAGQSETCMQDNRGFIPVAICDTFGTSEQIMADHFDLGRSGVLCSVFGGEISCLGTTTTPPSGSDTDLFVEVAVGQSHYCARTGAGAVTCWGTSERGALGLPTAE